jgi:hypothetical protein
VFNGCLAVQKQVYDMQSSLMLICQHMQCGPCDVYYCYYWYILGVRCDRKCEVMTVSSSSVVSPSRDDSIAQYALKRLLCEHNHPIYTVSGTSFGHSSITSYRDTWTTAS